MNKWDYIKKIAEKTGKSQAEVNGVINAMVEVIVEEVRDNGEQIAIQGLGTFKQKATAARTGRNPFNGETIQIKASRNIQFRPQASLKTVVEEKKKGKKK